MTVNQEKVDFQYTKLVNAGWEDEPTSEGVIVTHDSETLMHKDLHPEISPFIATSFSPIDPQKFHADREARFGYCRKFWPVLQNCRTFYTNKDWRRFHKEMEVLNPKFTSPGPAANRDQLFRYYRNFGKIFTPFSEPKRGELEERLGKAENDSPKLCYELRKWMRAIGWHELLENQFFAIKEQWISVFYMLSPIYMALYWDSEKNNLDEYHLAQKRFADLKPFFVDVFESLARISVYAVGIEGIILNGGITYTTKKGPRPLEDFKKMDNGSKWDVLQKLVIAPHFSELTNSRLRNGIGHNAAHYEVKSDSIAYRNESKTAGTISGQISYTQFCFRLLALYQAWEVASVYIWWLCAFDIENVRHAVEDEQETTL